MKKVSKSLENKVNKLIELLNDSEVFELFSDNQTELNNLCEKISDTNEGKELIETLSVNQVVNHWFDRGELYDLAQNTFDAMDGKAQNKFIKENTIDNFILDNYNSKSNKEFICSILDINIYTSKENILNELSYRL